jgi:transposase
MDSLCGMIGTGFLDIAARQELTAMMRDGKAEGRVVRRANAILLLDEGWNCEEVAEALFLDDDTVRDWHRAWIVKGIKGLGEFGYKGSACELTDEQQAQLKAWVTETLPRSTAVIGAWILQEYEIDYTRSAIIKLMHRIGIDFKKPKAISKKLDVQKQQAFIDAYNKLLNGLSDDEAVMFADAVHPTHTTRPVGCWAPKDQDIAIDQSSGRDRLNIHGAVNLETGETRIVEPLTVNAVSTIALLSAIEGLYPKKRKIHVFLDNAKYHHAEMVQEWLNRPDCRIVLHFIPTYCPHLDSIERLWGVMHKNITHNKVYSTFKNFADVLLTFLRVDVPKNWHLYRDSITDNFRVINPKDFRVIKA